MTDPEEFEDAEDVAIYDQRKAELAKTGNVMLSAEVTAAMLRGDTLEQALRRFGRASERK